MTNAIKYSPGVDTVIVRLVDDSKAAVLSMRDFSIGIYSAHLWGIFERFYRVSDADERTFVSLGLGLYPGSAIVDWHDRAMRVESAKGASTTFMLPFTRDSRAQR